ncbi:MULTISPECIES: phage replisome organizer N-terminal domain-containing protein [unclassified Lactococcus]|uniref:phage replisome organizer N-terminal domain-containing protein n=1 Tax=unclassified Lactococcus TaxID=2643510 RepID=UPI0011CB8058|nr:MULTISPECIES: phage replisome organizer N-terminal domain-containing protein [unclassified Lactococcus]MQW21978.1 replication protein [Lactococcus sp. dk101]TXK36841.1 replication protein [Lactococcus sp. dk310]TXK47461.1 replication protein [Lactococcus sp. dk322]
MAEISWIKLNVNIFDDEKMKLIDKLPENDAIFRIWVYLLSLAGKTNDSGLVYLSNHIPYTDEMIAALCNRPISIVRLALMTFKNYGMIDVYDNSYIAINNWEKHQNIDGMDKIREQNRLRKQKQREKIQALDSHVTSRDSHATDKIRIDKNRKEEEKNTTMSGKPNDVVPYTEIIDYLNEKTGKKFSNKATANKKLIKARWNEGYRVDEFKKVIDNMCKEWQGIVFSNGKSAEAYLKPDTLFGSKFDKYLNTEPSTNKPTSNKLVKPAPEWSNTNETESTELSEERKKELKVKYGIEWD